MQRGNDGDVIWTGPQSARATGLDEVLQLLRLVEGMLCAQMPAEGGAPETVRELLRRCFPADLYAMIERLAHIAEPLETEAEAFDDLFGASRGGMALPARAPELSGMIAELADAVAPLVTLLTRRYRAAAAEAAAMDRAGAALIAGTARAQARGNLIVQKLPANRADAR